MENKYYTTIGLEIHAELKTKSKMFCGCLNNPDEPARPHESGAGGEKPNVNICPVCMAHPGTLPVANKQAIENVIRVGLALDAKIADFTEFDRKNYFYPDIPKGYQISQYQNPIVSGGELAGVKITRVHLEEDTATSKHFGSDPAREDGASYSLVDFNRAGVPLMELVTEPVIHSSKDAGNFGRELQLLLRYLDVSEANMEKGEMRVELNISISPDKNKFGTKVEVKNINSFRAMERAAEFEVKRMTELLDAGKGSEIVQETRGWDEDKQNTFSQRKKEDSHDYRYFPDPDIPKFYLSKMFDIEKMKSELPELPEAKRLRYKNDYGIKDEDIESYIVDQELGNYFEEVAGILHGKDLIILASNFISNDLAGSGKLVSDFINSELLVETVEMVSKNELGSRAAKDIIIGVAKGFEKGQKIREFATKNNLIQSNDEGALKEIAQKVIDANPQIVATYKGGKENALMSLVGQIMKETKGSANPTMVQKILKELLS